ncbi:MAG: hypothetical protein DYH13_11150 [Alphaproteobacteria bacterium PRO2]|nr:hypothetical protein [Alphaproteobacteria bacterium PRO2]
MSYPAAAIEYIPMPIPVMPGSLVTTLIERFSFLTGFFAVFADNPAALKITHHLNYSNSYTNKLYNMEI